MNKEQLDKAIAVSLREFRESDYIYDQAVGEFARILEDNNIIEEDADNILQKYSVIVDIEEDK